MDTGQSGSTPEISGKISIMCSNMPESLLETGAAKKHFGRFGRVKKILLRPKKQICIVEYVTPVAAERALLNAGAYDGFMFDVTWTKKKKTVQHKQAVAAEERKRPPRDDDPDWVPDSDVEDELTAMSAVPVHRATRQQPMQQDQPAQQTVTRKVHTVRPKVTKGVTRERPPPPISAWIQSGSAEHPVVLRLPTTMTTAEATWELHQLRTRVSRTPDEQKRTLDARDRILRAYGGTGSRVRAGGATIGTCPDMCPEKERLQRQVEHQVNILECDSSGEAVMCARRAVKQYSRSSADQETPMCYELRPPHVLRLTVDYLLCEIASCSDNSRVSLADWFQFMWDRFRSIRKDITQQALCCPQSVRLLEQCARFHAHCAARLADLEHAQFDQRLNTDNLTKCLQSLKHMYADLPAQSKPCEAEFRSYIALLNLGDANFCWEVKHLPQEIQKSEAITFTVQIFMALDNNNYVRFFRLVREKATYLQACILLRYFNDVRARGLARIVKAFAPRGASKYPVHELMDNLGFEDINSLRSFIIHYGLKFSRHDNIEQSVILDRNQFTEDSDPYPISRAVNLIESKRNCSVGEIIAGGPLPDEAVYKNHIVYTSFNENGTLKQSALLAEDLGYDTINDSNKNLKLLKIELERIPQMESTSFIPAIRSAESRSHLSISPERKALFDAKTNIFSGSKNENKEYSSVQQKLFSFKPAIPVVSSDVVKSSPEKLFTHDTKAVFAFSKPDNRTSSLGASELTKVWGSTKSTNVFGSSNRKADTFEIPLISKSVFGSNLQDGNKDTSLLQRSETTESNLFGKSSSEYEGSNTKTSNLFSGISAELKFCPQTPKNICNNSGLLCMPVVNDDAKNIGIGSEKDNTSFAKPSTTLNIFGTTNRDSVGTGASNLFRTASNENLPVSPGNTMFGQMAKPQNVFVQKSTEISKSEISHSIFKMKSDSFKQSANPFVQSDTKQDSKLFFEGSSNLFSKQIQPEYTAPVFNTAPSPKTVFSTALAQHKNIKKSPFASTLFGENKVINAAFGPLAHDQNLQSCQVEEDQKKEQRMQEEITRQQKELETRLQQEEMVRLDEQRRQEELRRQELRVQEEARKREYEKQRQEELQRKLEQERKQTELKVLAEENRKREERQKAEALQKLLTHIEKESLELVEELSNDIAFETVKDIVGEEIREMNNLINFANTVSADILQNVTNEFCEAEIKAEKFRTEKLMLKYGKMWRAYSYRNIRRRLILHDTPVWLADRSPQDAAKMLRRNVLPAALVKMADFHKGQIFTGEPKLEPTLTPYDIIDLVRTSLLKGLRRIKVNYHECFFWKITVSSPGVDQWLHRKVNIHDWLLKKLCNENSSSRSAENVIYLKKQSWNNLMNFAISVSMLEQEIDETIKGSNGIIFYPHENDNELMSRISKDMEMKSPNQLIPVVVLASSSDTANIEALLCSLANARVISVYKIFKINRHDTLNSLDKCTKSALKWLAKNIPDAPPLEMDSFKSVLHQCVGMEFWYRLKLERHTRMDKIYKDPNKLIALYNSALERLSNILSDDNIRAYPSFPTELKQFLEADLMLPASYEFFPNDWTSSDLVKEIKNTIHGLTLQPLNIVQSAADAADLQQQVKNFVDEIEWFEDPSLVSCKIISYLPGELANRSMDAEDFTQYYEHYDFLDVISVVVVEKINSMCELNDKYAVYDKSVMANFRNIPWWYETEIVSKIKHKPLHFIDDAVDEALNESFARNSKRMRYDDSRELFLALEDKDECLLEESINILSGEILKLNSCNASVKELERCLDEETIKAANLEEILRGALYDQ